MVAIDQWIWNVNPNSKSPSWCWVQFYLAENFKPEFQEKEQELKTKPNCHKSPTTSHNPQVKQYSYHLKHSKQGRVLTKQGIVIDGFMADQTDMTEI